MDEYCIDSFGELHRILMENYERVQHSLFRGQASTDWDVVAKAGRREYADMPDLLRFRIWKKSAAAYTDMGSLDDWHCLALAQHHGLATRLLDWSFNPLVACYFAVDEESDNTDGVIKYDPIKQIDLSKKTIFDCDIVAPFRPSHTCNRQTAQQGCFTYHPNPKRSFQDDVSLKIIIPKNIKAELRRVLDLYGFNHQTMFPDLDGLSKYRNWRSMDFAENKGLKPS
ncbi:MAG: FRG domain-containing protein [Cytophagales bacterium]|nr:FRG domain-containing protein [Cytophagales bacterium]